ncbi:hypothetical protein QJS10_CPB15g00886 [Acorus calamus]|uniref:Uncharacterized protein n=1 Tax=Acorus calamus TaxID=4465 RepID=A0AAV9D721_ACOCL|nr:hypothetical protein QJS10_CPB15g00886 [Acorus calamus]
MEISRLDAWYSDEGGSLESPAAYFVKGLCHAACQKLFLDACRSSLVEKMHVLDELAYHNKKSTSTPANLSSGKTSQVTFGASVKLPNGVA